MKKLGIVMLCVSLVIMPTKCGRAIIWTVVRAALVKAIKAMDLAVQALQDKRTHCRIYIAFLFSSLQFLFLNIYCLI